jgi:type II secretory ATPase GspE/PulE/Tfp pilus assembly ATPase PilB-like protein
MLCSNVVGGLRGTVVGGLRDFLVGGLALVLLLAGGEALQAQDAWPASAGAFARGPGFYLAFYKLFLLLFVFWLWVKSADWVSRDSAELGEAIGMPSQVWNPIMVFSFLLVFMTLGLGVPLFGVGFALVSLAYLGPFVIYVVMRNGKVTQDKKVFTPAHIKIWLSNLGKRGPKREMEVKHGWQMGPPVELSAVGPLQMENQSATIDARQSPGFVPLKFLVADALAQRADKIMLDYTADAVAVRYEIDGLWHPVNPKVHEKDPLNRELGDMMLAVVKRICHLNMTDRRSRQDGKLKIELSGNKYDGLLLSQGTQTGERAILTLRPITKHVPTLENLGMRDKLREQVQELIGPGAKGMVVFSALPGDGLTSTWIASLRGTDRLMRDFMSVEATNKREPDVENVDVTKFDPALKETPEQKLPACILRQPEVMCLPEVATGEALNMVSNWIVDEDKLSLVSVRAKEAPEALLRLIALKPGDKFPQVIKAVINQRLVRKLCEVCREAIQPDPALLQRLGIPAGRVQVLFREKQPLPPGQEAQRKRGEPLICPNCNGLGYRGRTAIFEVMVVDDKMRQALAGQPKLDVLKQLSRAAGNRSLQEEGILLIALGTTSLTELQRVLKQ